MTNEITFTDEMSRFVVDVQKDHNGIGSQQITFRFENNFGASVIRNEYSHWQMEIAVIEWTFGNPNKAYKLVYDTGITDDVMYPASPSEAREILSQIRRLPARAEIIEVAP